MKRMPWFLVWGLMLALALRLPLLTQSLWMDEAAQVLESARPWSQQLALAYDFQPPLFHLVVAAMVRLGHAEWWLRLAALVPGLGAIGLSVAAVQRWSGRSVARLAMLFVAVSSLHVFYSQELRPYALSAFWVALAFYAWVRYEGQRSWWLVLTAAITGALYTSYVAVFSLPSLMACTLLWKRRWWYRVFAAASVAALFFGAWFPGLLQQLQVGSELRTTLPSWSALVSFSQMQALPLTLAKFLVGVWRVDVRLRDAVMVGGPFLLAGVLAVRALQREIPSLLRTEVPRWLLWWLLCAATLGTTWLFSFVTPIVAPKRLLFLLPWFFAALAAIPYERTWRWARTLLLLACFTWQVVGLGAYWLMPSLQREPWREVVATMSDRFEAADTAVVFAFDEPFAPWRWYEHPKFAEFLTGKRVLTSADDIRSQFALIGRYRYVLVFDYLRDVTDPYRVIDAVLRERGFEAVGTIDGGVMGFVHIWERPQLYAGAR